MGKRKPSREAFDKKTQQLAASLVLLDPGDLSSFQKLFEILGELEKDPWARHQRGILGHLRHIRDRAEHILMEGDAFSREIGEIEEALSRLTGGARQQQLEEPEQTGRPEQENGSEDGAPEPVDMDPWSDPELFREFLSEARENLDSIEVDIVHLEEKPDDKEAIDRVFRAFHTIKGVSGFLNLHSIHTISHRLEDLLDRAREGRRPLDPGAVDAAFEGMDMLKRLLDGLEARLEGLADDEPTLQIQSYLDRLGKILEIPDSPQPPDPQPDHHGPCVSGRGKGYRGGGHMAFQDEPGRDIDPQPEGAGGDLPQRPGGGTRAPVEGIRSERPQPGAATVRVDLEKLDRLVDRVGELVVLQALIQQNPVFRSSLGGRLGGDIDRLGRIISEIQRIAMSLRMVPLRHCFQKMVRLVRDLSRKSGKQVELTLSGQDTEIDRNMVDVIHDPLVHMIRNAIDHGIEPPEGRKAVGKPAMGSIHLKACHRGGSVVIEVKDDGAGLDAEKILRKAREKGIVGPTDHPGDHEIHRLIFHPGFSTAERVTNISGRGVGMDVVRRAIESLRGNVEILSAPGEGCTFVIRLPLTLSIIDGLIVRVGTERYVLPALSVLEAFRPEPANYLTVHDRGEMIHNRGRLLPLMRLHRLFDVPTARSHACEAMSLLVEHEGEARCLMVDDVLAKQDVVIKGIDGVLHRPPGVSGGAILGDGRVGLILDIAGIFRMHDEMEMAPPATARGPGER